MRETRDVYKRQIYDRISDETERRLWGDVRGSCHCIPADVPALSAVVAEGNRRSDGRWD